MTVASEDLPSGWELATIAEVTQPVPNIEPTRQPGTIFNYIDISSIDNRRLEVTEPRRITGSEAPSRAKRPVEDGDVLFSNVRTYLRNVARISGIQQPAVASTGFTVLRPNGRVLQDFLFRWVASDEFLQLVTPMQTGTHYPATSDRVVRAQHIPLPPLAEQRRIIDLLDRLDDERTAALFNLARVKTLLGDFHRTVLSSACSGRLTEDWRLDHPDLEAADAEYLLACRQAEQGRRFKAVKPSPHAPESEIPEQWSRVPLGVLLRDLKYGTSKRSEYAIDGTPVIRIPNVSGPSFDSSDLKFTALTNVEREALSLRPGDLLMIRSNGSVELVGKTMLVPEEAHGMAFAGYLMRLRLDSSAIDPSYAELVLASPDLRKQIEMPARSTSGVHNINSTEVRGLVIALPPLSEQREIVRRVEGLLREGEEILAKVAAASLLLERTGQAALTKAFRGELVS